MMKNDVFFVGIDSHQEEHTAVMANRLEEEKGSLSFKNTRDGINQFLSWLKEIKGEKKLVIGIEGGGRTRKALVGSLLKENYFLYEVNPLYTKQRRDYGPSGNKSDSLDAKLVIEVLIRKLGQLPRLTLADYQLQRLVLKRTVSFYEDLAWQRARIKNQLKPLNKERSLALERGERQLLNLIIKEKQRRLRRITKMEKRLKEKLSLLLETNGNNLTTMKGISTILAAKIVAQTRSIERFSNINQFIKYAGIAPLERSSGKIKRYRKNKKGNRKLNSAFYLAAINQLRWNQKAKEYCQKKISEGKSKKQALRCLMKRVACIVYGMLKSGKPYQA